MTQTPRWARAARDATSLRLTTDKLRMSIGSASDALTVLEGRLSETLQLTKTYATLAPDADAVPVAAEMRKIAARLSSLTATINGDS